MTNHPEIKVFSDTTELFQFAAKDFSDRAIAAVADQGVFSVVLAGGNTPKLFFDILTKEKTNIPWQKIKFFFGDERYVPLDDIESNYRMAYEHLFSKVPVHPENIYRIPTEYNDPNNAAKKYEQTLKKVFHIKDNLSPLFDLVYLGLGVNAHTASLMPLNDIVRHAAKNSLEDADNSLVSALFVSETNMHRITLTPTAINHAETIIFLVAGKKKANAVADVLGEKINPILYPAQLIKSIRGKTIWYLDQAAATKIS